LIERSGLFDFYLYIIMKKCFIVASIILLTGCEKKVDFKLHDQPDKLVVEATIENGQAPVVILSKSVGYFSKISLDLLSQTFVHGADVFVSNGNLIHKLKEYSKPLANGFPFYYYSIDSSNLATSFLGQLKHQYSLKIVTGGKEYTATTTVPDITKRIDSVWWKKAPATSDSSRVIIMVRVTDPPGYGDYVRYYTKTNREPFYPPLNSTYDDFFVDGTTYEIQIDKGVDRNITTNDNENFFKRGDTVGLKLSNIDKATFDFWRTMEFSYSTIGDPFSTPTKVLSNIKGDALGYFGGYASQYRTLIIPH
jgi:Domain of unknown function (DUF4249)